MIVYTKQYVPGVTIRLLCPTVGQPRIAGVSRVVRRVDAVGGRPPLPEPFPYVPGLLEWGVRREVGGSRSEAGQQLTDKFQWSCRRAGMTIALAIIVPRNPAGQPGPVGQTKNTPWHPHSSPISIPVPHRSISRLIPSTFKRYPSQIIL